MIRFINLRFNLDFPESLLDNSPFEDNPWLSGFIDADGHFFVRKTTCGFELMQSITDHNNNSKKEFKLKLAEFLKVPLKNLNKSYCSAKNQYGVRTNKLLNNLIIIKYLNIWPLKSSKYLNFKDFEYVASLRRDKEHLTSINKE